MGGEREIEGGGSLQIGPTSLGMVRIIVDTAAGVLPLDFEPDEAEEMAEELRAAAERARALARRG